MEIRRSGSPDRVDVGGLTLNADMRESDFSTMTLINDGTTRRVWQISDNLVLKVPLYDSCVDDQQSEIEVWLKVTDEDKPHFAKPYIWADDFSWSVYELAHGVGTDRCWMDQKLREAVKRYDVTDLHSGNFGWRITPSLRQPIIIDYAATYGYS